MGQVSSHDIVVFSFLESRPIFEKRRENGVTFEVTAVIIAEIGLFYKRHYFPKKIISNTDLHAHDNSLSDVLPMQRV